MFDSFANRLKQLRREEKLSQEELGSIIGVNRSTISQWESGLSFASMTELRKLAIHFNVSCDYLSGRTNSRQQVTVSPVSEVDFSKLNSAGMMEVAKFYNYLLTREEYLAD